MKKLASKIKIHPITYVFALLALISGLFKYLLIIFVIVTFHELGHITIALILKRKVKSIEFYPTGGYIRFEGKISENIYEDLLISISGVLFQIILALALKTFKNNTMYSTFSFYNNIIIIFNLIPLAPLDGHKIIKLLCELFIPYKKTFTIMYMVFWIISLALVLIKSELVLNNIFVSVFVISMNIIEYKNRLYLLNRFYLERMNYDFSHYKRVYIYNVNKMYKNKYHYICNQNERAYLRKKYFTFYKN